MSEPFFILNVTSRELGESIFRCTGENTELYVHGPNYRDVDHIFHRYDETDRRLGGFVFRSLLGEDEFERIKKYVYSAGTYPITYRPTPTDGDMDEFIKFESQDIDTNFNEGE